MFLKASEISVGDTVHHVMTPTAPSIGGVVTGVQNWKNTGKLQFFLDGLAITVPYSPDSSIECERGENSCILGFSH